MASPQAVRLFEQIYAKVDAQVRDIVNSMLPTVSVAAQDDGSVIANQHRILNFQGEGVTVTEDPALRRVNVFVPGAPTTSASTTIVSSTSAKARSMWNGSSNDAPPSGWEQPGFNDAAWSNAVNSSDVDLSLPPANTIWSSVSALSSSEVALVRLTFTLPAGSITSATIHAQWDDVGELYLNGRFIFQDATPGGLGGPLTTTLSPSQLNAGASNLIAVRGQNNPPTGLPALGASLAFYLTVAYASGGTDTRYQLVSEKNAANGYAGLDSGTRVPTARLGSGTASSSTYLRGDQTWAAVSAGMTNPMTTQDDIIVGGSSGTPARLAKGSDSQVLTVDPTTHHLVWATPSGGGGSLSSISSGLASNLTMTNANTWYDVASLSLAAGTWLVLGQALLDNASNQYADLRIWDGTTVFSQTEYFPVGGTIISFLAAHALVVLASTTSIRVSCAAAAGGYILRATQHANSASAGLASMAHAVKIA